MVAQLAGIVPVGDDNAGKAHALAQDVAKQPFIAYAGHAIKPHERGHDQIHASGHAFQQGIKGDFHGIDVGRVTAESKGGLLHVPGNECHPAQRIRKASISH